MSDPVEEPRMQAFAEHYKKLDAQCSYYCRHFGHLRALIENDDWLRVVGGSMTGRVLLLGNSEVTNALILFNTRMFDTGPDAYSVHKLNRFLPSVQEIEEHHLRRSKQINISYTPERHISAREDFIEANRKLKRNNTKEKLRSLRTYTLAHNLDPKTEPELATLNDLLELTEAVHELVDLAGFIIESSRGAYKDFAKQAEEETRTLYRTLPDLAEAESSNWVNV